jgi:hypothetical protein
MVGRHAPLQQQLAVLVEALDPAVDRAIEGDGRKPRRRELQRRVPRARKTVGAGPVAQTVGRARGDADEGAGFADAAGERQMLDELALAFGGPAGVALAAGCGFELGQCRRGRDIRDFLYDSVWWPWATPSVQGVAPDGACGVL